MFYGRGRYRRSGLSALGGETVHRCCNRRSGGCGAFRFSSREIAVIAASHSGEPIHVEAVTSILDKIGMDASALQCGIHWPYDENAAETLRREGRQPTVLHNNCSGKHAGILALCKVLGADTPTYLSVTNPAQRYILDFCARLSDDDAATWPIGIDGCGIPVYATSLRRAALSFARLATSRGVRSTDAAALRTVRDAMLAHPLYVAGTGQLDTELMLAGDGNVVSKAGAEGVHGVGAVTQGCGYVSKVLDGSPRARGPSTMAVLHRLGILDGEQLRSLLDLRPRKCIIGPGASWGNSASPGALPSKKRVKLSSEYLRLLAERVLIFDGAMGTQLMALDLSDDDFGGAPYRGCNEALVLTRPELVRAIHESYLAAGADVVETDTFTASRLKLDEYGLGERTREINLRAASLAREACDELSTPEHPRFVAGSMGPTGMLIFFLGSEPLERHLRASCAIFMPSRRAHSSTAVRISCCSRRCRICSSSRLRLREFGGSSRAECDRWKFRRSRPSLPKAACFWVPIFAQFARRSMPCTLTSSDSTAPRGLRRCAIRSVISARMRAASSASFPNAGLPLMGTPRRDHLS